MLRNVSGRSVPGQDDALQPAGVPDGVAVGTERARRGVELLDAAVPEVAALVASRGRRAAPRFEAASRTGWRFAGSRRPWSALNTPSACVSKTGKSWYAPSSTTPSLLGGREHRQPEQLHQPRRLGALRLRRHTAALELRMTSGQRRPHAHHHIAERAQLRGHLVRGAWLEEDRAQPDRRLRCAHLLQHRQLERALHRDDPAVVHAYPPRLPRMRSTASARRSSGTVSEMRKKPSPLGP